MRMGMGMGMGMGTSQSRGTFVQEESGFEGFDRRVLLRLLGYLARDRRRLLIAAVAVLVVAGTTMAQPALIGLGDRRRHSGGRRRGTDGGGPGISGRHGWSGGGDGASTGGERQPRAEHAAGHADGDVPQVPGLAAEVLRPADHGDG